MSRALLTVVQLFLAFLIPVFSLAQTGKKLDFELLNGSDGLSQGLVTQIIQDKTGFMWFGTNDGLNNYDGYEFTIYRHKARDPHSIADDAIRSVFEDSKGRLWIGTAFKGIDLFDRRNGRFIHVNNPLAKSAPANYIRSIAEDRSGNLWVCSSEGIYRITVNLMKDGTPTFHFVRINAPAGYHQSFFRLYVAANGRVYLVSTNKICEIKPDASQKSGYQPQKCVELPVPDNDFPATLLEDTLRKSFFWLAGKELWKFEGSDFSNPKKVYASTTNIKAGVIDMEGRLWIEDKGKFLLFHTQSGAIEAIGSDESLLPIIQNTVCHYLDRTGTIWMGTFGYGVLRYNPDKANFHHILPHVNAYPITSTPIGEIIVNASEVVKIDRSGLNIKTSLKKLIPEIQSYEPFVAIDKTGNYWFLSKTGVFHYNAINKHKERYNLEEMGEIQTFPPYLDESGTLWIASSRFLIAFDTRQRKFRTFSMPLKPTSDNYSLIECITADKNGFLWLATVSGLLRFDRKTNEWKSYAFEKNDPNSISSNLLLCVYADTTGADRYLWIGTKGAGLERFDKLTEKFTHYNDENGLPNNVVYGILPDKTGDLWVSTNNGLSRFIQKDQTFQNFTVKDGLQDNEFNRYAFHKRNDTLYFGGLRGVNYFVPEQIKSHAPPVVFFSGFKLFNRPVDITLAGSPVREDISYVSGVDLKHSQNMIGLKFAVADYHQIGQVKYSYMLEGFDKQWIYSGTTHEATYTNLDPGQYRFLVKASYDGVTWSKVPAVISVRIIPPWWNSGWFFGLMVVAIVAALYGIYRYRLAQILRVANIRNSISRDLHDEIGSTLSTITIYAKVGSEQLKMPQNSLDSIFEKIRENAFQAQEAMHDIIWSTNTDNDQFENIINHMRGYANQLCDINGYELNFDTTENTTKIKLDMVRRREFFLIFKEALTNIVKHSNGSKVWIEMMYKTNQLTLVIRDNGQGFGEKSNFRQGNGLSNMRSRAENLGGTLEITSIPGSGTTVTLQFQAR